MIHVLTVEITVFDQERSRDAHQIIWDLLKEARERGWRIGDTQEIRTKKVYKE